MAHLKGTRMKKLKKRFSELFHSNYVRFGVILPLFFLFTVYAVGSRTWKTSFRPFLTPTRT